MTDRYNALVVVLERDTRDDDAQRLIDVIKSIKGVAEVTGNVVSPSDFTAEIRAEQKWRDKIINLLNEK